MSKLTKSEAMSEVMRYISAVESRPIDLKDVAKACHITEWEALKAVREEGLLKVETLSMVLIFPPNYYY